MKIAIIATYALLGVLFFQIGFFTKLPVIQLESETEIIYEPVYLNQTIPADLTERIALVYGIGVYENTTDGELIEVWLSLREGNGDILVDSSETIIGTDLQESLTIVKLYAQSYTQTSLENLDFIIHVRSIAYEVYGTSGSAAMAVGLISLIENQTLEEGVVLTGVLTSHGSINGVQGLSTKIIVADIQGIDKILVPQSQCYEAEAIQDLNIEMVCVSNIEEALAHMVE